MDKNQLKATFAKIDDICNQTREDGQKEYARLEGDAFGNFRRIQKFMPEMTKEQILAVYLLKHIDGILSYLNGHKSQREDVRGRIVDAINYLKILYAMIEDSEEKEQIPIKHYKPIIF